MPLKVHYKSGELKGHSLDFDDDHERIEFGRDAERCDVVFPASATMVGREHCALERVLGRYRLITNGTNPVFLDGRPGQDDDLLKPLTEMRLGEDGPLLLVETVLDRRLEPTVAAGRGVESPPTLRQRIRRSVLTNRVIALERSGRSEEAVAALEALISATPDENRAYLRLAEILTELGREEESLNWLEKAPVQDAEVVVRMYNATVPLYNAGRFELAAEVMRRAIAIAPEVAQPHRMLGQALIGTGDLAGAEAELREFLRLDPDDPEAETARLLIQELEKKK